MCHNLEHYYLFIILLCALTCSTFGEDSDIEETKNSESQEFLQSLKDYEDTLTKQINAIDNYFSFSYADEKALTEEFTEEYVSNPINVYKMIKRHVFGVPKMTQPFQDPDQWDDILNKRLNDIINK